MKRTLLGVLLVFAVTSAQAEDPSARTVLSLPEAGGWDYLTFDAASRHLYVTRGDHVDVVDIDRATLVGRIDDTQGVHGVALVAKLRRGFASDGKADSVTVFDMDTLKTLSTIHLTGKKPDAILFDAASGHVLAFNGNSDNASVIDPATATQIGSIELPGAPEFAASDGAGHVFVNLEDRNALARIDTHAGKVDGNFTLTGCQAPSGLALDTTHHRLFSVCANHIMAITDASTGEQRATVAIGEGPDAAGYDPATGRIFSSNGLSGNLTVIEGDTADHYRVVNTIPTQKSARTMALDSARGQVLLAAATVTPASGGGRGTPVTGTFKILAVPVR